MSAVQIVEKKLSKISFKQIGITILTLKTILIAYFIYLFFRSDESLLAFDSTFLGFIAIGFFAQMIDGALGMAYGVSCTTFLLNFGVPPALASASVHTAEIFTTGASGLSHIKFKNIDKDLFFKLVITGVVGAVLGAYLLSGVLDGGVIKPYVAGYLLLLGFYLIYKGFAKKVKEKEAVKKAPLLALIGGFMDTVGGGGWGPIVTSNLLAQGKNPRQTIGTVNTAEFFVTFFATAIFIFILGVQYWQIILGLIVGGVVAAPFGAYVASRINKKVLLFAVGVLIILTSSYTLYKVLS
ncbi:sulfite exporter TauE/SafE family protein [Arenibacter sp. GZD96]|uniref:sulfite exporter TauE/SafE family protein n=1 Tax=Aurantibrevibacter litoralis TaxID=3106030 RepID=UPI002AFDCBB7|nr:sulfite exporter TauE/SafE family protein [Arenibacter sp. GZD-96]MEA1784833.1 sulfite exporter TauE/SafE family protein [Arenibacter sp. GZD-96]